MVRKNGRTDDRPIEWCVKTADKLIFYIDYMLYIPIEWYAKTAELMTDIINGQSRSDIDTHMCKNGGIDDRHIK